MVIDGVEKRKIRIRDRHVLFISSTCTFTMVWEERLLLLPPYFLQKKAAVGLEGAACACSNRLILTSCAASSCQQFSSSSLAARYSSSARSSIANSRLQVRLIYVQGDALKGLSGGLLSSRSRSIWQKLHTS